MKKLIFVMITLLLGLCACNPPQAHAVLISAGGQHTCALSADGRIWCWGSNEKGQLGDGVLTDSLAPVQVSGLEKNNIIAVAAGGQHTCALSADGRIWCWGSNEKGQLGNGTLADSPAPVQVSGLGNNTMIAVAAGGQHTCALSAQGRVLCWGSNEKGQLGNGTLTDSLIPLQVSGLENGAAALAAGSRHTCVLTGGDGVRCWGSNDFGQLGNKTKKDSPIPVAVSGLGSGMHAIAAGGGHSCALSDSGGVLCWGWNGNEAENHYAPKPESVSGLGSDVTAIAAGGEHICALTRNNAVKCWGSNYVGQLGNESLPASSVPVDVSGLGTHMLAIATGGYHTCVLNEGAGVECWGQNYQGELGNPSKLYSATPVNVVGLKMVTFASLTATAAPTPTSVPPTLVPWPIPGAALPVLQPGQPVTLTSLRMLDASTGWGLDAGGHILRTTDGGGSWKSVNPPGGAYDERSFFPADANTAWAAFLPVLAGSEGCNRVTNCHLAASIWRTTDGGASWQSTETWQAARPLPRPADGSPAGGPSSAAAHGLYFVDPTTGWFLLEDWGADTNILTVLARTSDGGKSLREIWRNEGIARYTGVVFLNKQVGYLSADPTTFFERLDGLPALNEYLDGRQAPYLEKTTDGGKTWESVRLPTLNPIPDGLLALASSQEHMLCGIQKLELVSPQGIKAQVTCRVTGGFGPFSFTYLSTDGGESWHSWVSSDNEHFLDPIMGWRLNAGQFQATANGGVNWVTLQMLPWQAARFDFIGGQAGWAIVTSGSLTSLARTLDGGQTWTELKPVVANP